MTARRLFTPAALGALLTALGLAGCSSPTPPASQAAPAADSAAATADKAADLSAREQELARREAELAAREAALPPPKSTAAVKPAPKPVTKPRPPRPVASPAAAAAPVIAPRPAAPPPPLVVPAGTPISVALDGDVTTRTARIGDPVDAHVATTVTLDGRNAIPAGTRVRGTVSEVVSGSDQIGGTPTLGLRFDGIELQPGRTLGISGTLHEQGKSDTARDTAKIAGGALVGAIIGKQIGDSKGRLIGGLLGGAAGVAAAKKTGTEVVLPAGTTFTVVLDQSLTLP